MKPMHLPSHLKRVRHGIMMEDGRLQARPGQGGESAEAGRSSANRRNPGYGRPNYGR